MAAAHISEKEGDNGADGESKAKDGDDLEDGEIREEEEEDDGRVKTVFDDPARFNVKVNLVSFHLHLGASYSKWVFLVPGCAVCLFESND